MTVGIIQRDARSAEFFAATARGELLLRRCRTCADANGPGQLICISCGSDDLAWSVGETRGVVAMWTVLNSGAAAGAELVVGEIELADGPWMTMQLMGFAPDEISVGMPIDVAFERAEGGEAIPVAVPTKHP